jgi:hypothetical protein
MGDIMKKNWWEVKGLRGYDGEVPVVGLFGNFRDFVESRTRRLGVMRRAGIHKYRYTVPVQYS